ncbi:MAG: ydjP 1 [Gammaproteobacteria bacterium]|jgi:pimeloyl-ACP methyl ester carboxylesterase|nr:ydjP 1 [Gammaproteobacteria bacterium]
MSYIDIASHKMYYHQSGITGAEVILLHNAGGDHTFLFPQIETLSPYYRVTAVDFLGHGNSTKPIPDFLTIHAYAQHIRQLCQELKMNKITLIGLNYGANVAVEFFYQYPDIVDKIVMIDPPVLLSDEIKKLISKHLNELGRLSPESYAKDLVNHSFIKASDQVREKAYNVFKKTPHETMKAVYSDLLVWDQLYGVKRMSALPESVLCLFTDASLCNEETLKKHNQKIMLARVVASKYWATLEVPDQVDAMILRFLSL